MRCILQWKPSIFISLLSNLSMGNSIQIEIDKKHLIFRDDAKTLCKTIQRAIKISSSKSIILDFSKVDFVSRSFIDDFLNRMYKFKKEKIEVTCINLNPSHRAFMNRIKNVKKNIRKEIAGEYRFV